MPSNPASITQSKARPGPKARPGRSILGALRWRMSYRRWIQFWGIGFVMPTLLFLAVFKYGPMFWAFELSLTSYDMVSSPRFVGADNYFALAADPIFRTTLLNTFVYIAGSTILTTTVALLLALAINTRVPGARQCMTVMFLTNLMPIIAVCLVWRFLLHPYGLVNQLLAPFGFGRIDWLTDPATAMPAIIVVTVWRFAPYFMVVFLAGLLALPEDYYEAAQLDGAGPLRRFWHITLPLLAPVLFFVVVVSALLSARIFLMPYLITGGGPGNATRVLSMLIYETGFSYMKMGQAAAISVVLFAIMMVFTVLQMRLFMRNEHIYA
ncbi:MAG: sugar ABC transporter permease [Alphaproteobacteria bacterium]|nr:sugar ABC transporter permease [Alphaproteobacteria bacterium]